MDGKDRSTRHWHLILLAICAFVAGLFLAVWAPRGNVPRVVGAVGVVSGLFLLLSRNLFSRDPDAPATEQQVAAEHQVRMGMRTLGASIVLFGAAQFVPDTHLRTALILCGSALSVAGAFRVPRRFFAPKGSVR
jgi:hypothetical protein